jgi:hypothetical protein
VDGEPGVARCKFIPFTSLMYFLSQPVWFDIVTSLTNLAMSRHMDRIFRLEHERTISNDWVLRYHNRWFQLAPQSRHGASAQDKVLVCEGRQGNIAIEYRGRALRWEEIAAPAKPIEIKSQPAGKPASEPKPPRPKWVPPSNHPWQEAARRGAQQRASKLALAERPSSA